MQPTGATFMELTQYDHLSPSDQNMKKTPPPLAKAVPKGAQYIPLPRPGTITVNPMDLRHAIEARRSLRHYQKEPISIEELSYLLWCTQGIVQVVDPFYTLRNVPSAGGRHALETYLLINRVTSLPPRPLSVCTVLPFTRRDRGRPFDHRQSDGGLSGPGFCALLSSHLSLVNGHLPDGLEVFRTGIPARPP